MALCIAYKCACGRKYSFYVPKRLLYKETIGTPEATEEGRREDEEDVRKGFVKKVEEIAEVNKLRFVDMSLRDVFQCECGQVFDLWAYLLRKKKGNKNK